MGRAFEFRKERKMKRWGNMAKTFTKIGREISIAVRDGGPDPASNSKLRLLIQNAKAANMPKDNVERAIKKASGKDQENWDQVTFEGYGPFGIAVIVEAATNNNNRTVGAVRSYFTKFDGSLGTSGSVAFMFEHKCVFKTKMKEGLDLEELELEMIDLGVSEIFEDEGQIHIYGEFESFGGIQQYLEGNDFEIESAEFERIPTDTKELNDEQKEKIEKMLAKFEDDEDVTNVFHNMA